MSVEGFYGSAKTRATIYAVRKGTLTWYAVHGSSNVNATRDPVEEGVDVETLRDVTCFTYKRGVWSHSDLLRALA